MTLETPFHPRTAELNQARRWRKWSGFFIADSYFPAHDLEYHAIRFSAALFDVTPMCKYRVSGPDAAKLVDRVITRRVDRIKPMRAIYTPWCDHDGRVLDDGTVALLADGSYFWTAAEPQHGWLDAASEGLNVTIEDLTERLCALSLQGPCSRDVLSGAVGRDMSDLPFFGRADVSIAGVPVSISRTGYSGDLGYELWIPFEQGLPVWDALIKSGENYTLRVAGMEALDVARLEAGLIMAGVDYHSSRTARHPSLAVSPYEIGMDRLVDLDKPSFIGKRALMDEVASGGPANRLVGLELDLNVFEDAYLDLGYAIEHPLRAWRHVTPLTRKGETIGRATSGTFSPLLKRSIALGFLPSKHAEVGSSVGIEWQIEETRQQIPATVVPLPFLDLPRKRS
ncbi:MAG: aminomethyltransferase family protein [Candidatus Limnocylindrus sp.]|jgi:aminomethyltransferase